LRPVTAGFALSTALDSSRTKEEHISLANLFQGFVMSEPASSPDIDHYEQACDQAIAMCDGNLRSTIKALIMANEYLEIELRELQMAASTDRAPARLPRASGKAA
jgi:hypothetical protein